MAITYVWSINQLECLPKQADKENVVFKVGWSLRGTDDAGVGSSRGGVTEVELDPKSKFTPFNELTEEQVLGWVKPTITFDKLAEMETGIIGDINWQNQHSSRNEPVSPPLPWPDNR